MSHPDRRVRLRTLARALDLQLPDHGLAGEHECELLLAEVRRALCRAEAVQEVFAGHLSLFESVEAAALAVASRAEAEEVYRALRAGERELPGPIPPTPRILPEPAAEGYLGLVTRTDLPPEAAEAVFADGTGEFVGPIPGGGRWWIYRILMGKRAELNDAVYVWCEDLLVELALQESVAPTDAA